MAGAIFVSYRRGDEPWFTRHLGDRLRQEFGDEDVFVDVDSLGPTNDFTVELSEAVKRCKVLLVVVGRGWLGAEDRNGRRLGRPEDFVTMEIALALGLGKLVIPLLVNQTPAPRPDELPQVLQGLLKCQSYKLDYDRFEGDFSVLLAHLERVLGTSGRSAQQAAATPGSDAQAEATSWSYIKDSNNPSDLRNHLKRFPNGVGTDFVWKRLEEMVWQSASALTDPGAVQRAMSAYLSEFPQGKYRQSAEAKRGQAARIKAEQAARAEEDKAHRERALQRGRQHNEEWKALGAKPSVRELKEFVKRWPAGPQTSDAELLLSEKKRRRIVAAIVASVVSLILGGVIHAEFTVKGRSGWRLLHDMSADTIMFKAEGLSRIALRPQTNSLYAAVCDEFDQVVQHVCIRSSVREFDLQTRKETRTVFKQTFGVVSLAVSPDGRYVLMARGGVENKKWAGGISIGETATGVERQLQSGPNRVGQKVEFSPDGRTAYAATRSPDDSRFKLAAWDVASGRLLFDEIPEGKLVGYFLVSPDGKFVLTALETVEVQTGVSGQYQFKQNVVAQNLIAVGASNGKLLRRFSRKPGAMLFASTFSSDGKFLITPGENYSLVVWNAETGAPLRDVDDVSAFVQFIALHPDRRRAFVGTDAGTIEIRDLQTGKAEGKLTGHTESVTDLWIAPDGKTMISAAMRPNSERSIEVKYWKLD